jgi:hypothetical protein
MAVVSCLLAINYCLHQELPDLQAMRIIIMPTKQLLPTESETQIHHQHYHIMPSWSDAAEDSEETEVLSPTNKRM